MINKFFKKYGIFIGAVLIVGAAFFYLKFNLPMIATKTGAQLTIDFKDNKSKKFEGAVVADMTILGALYASSLGDDFELRYSIQEDGSVTLAKIGDTINFGNKSWHFYLNNERVQTSDINKIKIKAGDLIEAKYE